MRNNSFNWKSAKLIPKKCGKAYINSLNECRCGKLILSFYGIMSLHGIIENNAGNLSTLNVDKFVKKCAEMRKYIKWLVLDSGI
jgi:hypothetical protein